MSLIGYIDEPVTPDAAVDALISKVGGTAVSAPRILYFIVN